MEYYDDNTNIHHEEIVKTIHAQIKSLTDKFNMYDKIIYDEDKNKSKIN